jgi:FlaA1/EpsC-like NDP-sugar epimerase
MTSLNSFADWNRLLVGRNLALAPSDVASIHGGKTVLVTGAGGSIGSALVRCVARQTPELLILLDHSEQNLYEIESELSGLSPVPKFRAVLGDIADRELASSLFEEHRPDFVYHSAAFKHVPLMEANPFAAVRNNAIATWHLARLAAEHGVAQFLLISTDKAANPRSIMGASKRLAELAVLRWNFPGEQCSAIRLGNVLGSHGSVVPLFLRQIAEGKSLTVTHKDVSRYFLTMEETVETIFRVASVAAGGGLFLPEMGEPILIRALASRLLEIASPNGQGASGISGIEFTGLRPGDKLAEDLISPAESLEPTSQRRIHRIVSAAPSREALDSAFDAIARHARARNLVVLLEAIREIVPEYEPSRELLQRAGSALANSSSHA